MPAGFQQAKGHFVLTLGSFLQVEPGDISKMFAKIDEGYHLVNGWRTNRTDSHLNRWHTGFYNWLVAKVEKVVFKMEARTMEFMDLLNEPAT